MRRLRRSLDIGLPAVGTVLVFGAVVLVYNLTMQIILVLLGLVLIDAGIWKLTAPFLPNERRYNGLRAEVKRFLELVRHLNDATLNLKEADTPASRVAMQDAINFSFNGDVKGVLLSIADDPTNADHMVNPEDAVRAARGRH